jgi:DME family drug/metabolite transporter
VALAAMGWGTWALWLRGSGLPAAWQGVMILTTIALVFGPFALRDSLSRRRPLPWIGLAIVALTDAGNYFCYFGALDRGPIALAVLTHYLAPVVVAALAPLVLREKLSRRTLVALLVSLVGLALLVLGDGGVAHASALTAILGGTSALFYGANTLACKKLFDAFSVPELLAYHCLLSALLLLPFAGPLPPAHAFLWAPLAGAVLIGAGGGATFYLGLRLIPASRAAVLTYLEPLVAASVGFLFFHEAVGPAGLLGAAMIVGAGVAIALA